MAEAQYNGDGSSTVPPSGKVGNVRQQWLVYEDGALAHNEQEKEFNNKFEWNRKDRRTARKDVPLARVCQTEEEETKQRQAMERLEMNKEIAERDAIEAEKMMSEMILEEQRSRIAREMQDKKVASVLQEAEKKKYEQRLQEKALNKERKRIERDIAYQSTNVLGDGRDRTDNTRNSSLETRKNRNLREDGKVEDLGDFSDFYIPPDDNMDHNEAQHLREMQDEELARLLQDQEHKRGGQIDRDKLKAIEAQDEELARVIQEQEKLRLMKKKAKAEARRQLSQPVYGQQPPEYPPQRSHSDHEHRGPPGGHPVPSERDFHHQYPAQDQRSTQDPPVNGGGGGNVFAAIDPTLRDGDAHNNYNHDTIAPPRGQTQRSPDPEHRIPTYDDEGDEDGYCELPGDLAVVQGQRRDLSRGSTGRKGSKKGQCKQQ